MVFSTYYFDSRRTSKRKDTHMEIFVGLSIATIIWFVVGWVENNIRIKDNPIERATGVAMLFLAIYFIF